MLFCKSYDYISYVLYTYYRGRCCCLPPRSLEHRSITLIHWPFSGGQPPKNITPAEPAVQPKLFHNHNIMILISQLLSVYSPFRFINTSNRSCSYKFCCFNCQRRRKRKTQQLQQELSRSKQNGALTEF